MTEKCSARPAQATEFIWSNNVAADSFFVDLDRLNTFRPQLEQELSHALRAALFTSRGSLHPANLPQIVSSEIDLFFAYLREPATAQAQERGAALAGIGLAHSAMLRSGEILRRFVLTYTAGEFNPPWFERVEGFHRDVLSGYFRDYEAKILIEQERIRSALQQTLHRYTVQLETAAEVARTAISTLDLGALLTTVVDLIGERLALDYVAIYLLDDDNRFVDLRAATGLEGRHRLSGRHRLKANGGSMVARCLLTKRYILSEGDSEATLGETATLPNTQSEIVLPLITRGKVIGALSVQTTQPGMFSSQDVTGFQIMSDQLANAIENARLYTNAQQRAEDLAQAYDQLKELETLKDQFMQNVSHELRTPLTMIRGYAELLMMDDTVAASLDRSEALQVILRNTQALTELVADILSMLEASATRMAVTVASMFDAVRDSVFSFQYLAERNGLALEATLPENGSGYEVIARQDHLRRIADNLLANAIKFTPAGGRVLVRLWESEERVYLEVADTGIGIPSHLQERIFERFFQVDSSQRRVHGGAGLGLALVRELVESYSGTVTAASPGKDQGSVFTVMLPRVTTLSL